MPWTKDDVDSHKGGLTDKQKELWVKVANAELDKCVSKGGNDKVCAPKAIRIANSVVDGMKENEWESEEYQRRLSDEFQKLAEEKMESIKVLIEILKGIETDEAVDLIERAETILKEVPDFQVRERICKEINDYLATIKEPEEEIKLDSDIIPLEESDIKEVNIPIKIIQPGWGSSGYYSAKLLENSASKYKAGTLMFWDHPKESEEHDRPERSLRDLAGVLISEGTFKEDGKAGMGIYALCKPFPEFRTNIISMGKHIGISHVARGLSEQGEAEGRKGHIIKSINEVASVDFVTVAGAGGQVVSLFESAKNGGAEETIKQQEERMEKELKEAQDQLKLKDDELAKEKVAREAAEKKVKENDVRLAEVAKKEMAEKVAAITKTVLVEVKDLPEVSKSKIIVEPIIKEDGTLDEIKVKESINARVVAERNYLAELSKAGSVHGMGDTTGDETTKKHAQLVESFTSMYLKQGFSKERAAEMAGRAAR